MQDKPVFVATIVNPAAIRVPGASESGDSGPGTDDCRGRDDAPVCKNGNEDVTCAGERYRGCQTGQHDCADNEANPEDECCWGWGPGPGDNIDHDDCMQDDAGWGGISICLIFPSRDLPSPF